LPPVDQAATNPSFLAFRDSLAQAVTRKDAAFVEKVMAPDVKLSFGGESGIADFRRIWRPDQADSKLWTALGEILRLGGSFEPDGSFVAPYTFSRFPDDLDSFESIVVTGNGVALRAAPRTDAPLIARLSYDIVTVEAPPDPAAAWVEVRLADGRSGHVAAPLLRSPLDYRAGFAKREGEWRVIYLIAGD
jgi:hypothetical protein